MVAAVSPHLCLAEYQRLGGEAWLLPYDGQALLIRKAPDQKVQVGLKALKPAVGVRRLLLLGFKVEDADLQAIASWHWLEQVEVIDGKQITDKGVKALIALPNLQELVLADTAVTANGVSAFSGHKKLTLLTITNTVVDNCVKSLDLKELPNLRGVILVCEGLTTVRLTKLPKLEWIGNFPTELEQAELSDLPSLTTLDFSGTRLKKLSLTGVGKLDSLDLRKTRLDVKIIVEIKKSFPGVKIQK